MCWVNSTLGSPDWTARLNTATHYKEDHNFLTYDDPKIKLNLLLFICFNALFNYFTKKEISLLEAEFKEFEPRLKYGWYLIFQDLSRRSLETGFWQI